MHRRQQRERRGKIAVSGSVVSRTQHPVSSNCDASGANFDYEDEDEDEAAVFKHARALAGYRTAAGLFRWRL
jgi:hypothetical protein